MSQEQAGQGEPEVQMLIDRAWVFVSTTQSAAECLELDHHYVAKLCDMGKLIATKAFGRWWVHPQWYEGRHSKGLTF